MPLETASFINQLDSANPLGSDPIAAGDDHIRLIKAAIKATFPNITGAVTATHTALNTASTNYVPTGGIIMWSGATTAVPSGWALCNGANGTPDLRDRFVVGAGNSYAVGDNGGSASTTLVAANLPAHTHTFSATATSGAAGSHTHTINDPGHTHRLQRSTNGSWGSQDYPSANQANYNMGSFGTDLSYTGISLNGVGDHTHTISVSGTTSSVGSGSSFENRPPYYALAFIMKL